jgi:hypothetical protein
MNQAPDLQASMREIAEQIRIVHRDISGPEFILVYSKLLDRLFLGSFAQTMEKIQAGDEAAVEFGLVFIEVQPYYFRSQYHRTQLIRMLKHAPLSSLQAERLKRILDLEHDKKMKSPTTAVRKLLGDLKHKKR